MDLGSLLETRQCFCFGQKRERESCNFQQLMVVLSDQVTVGFSVLHSYFKMNRRSNFLGEFERLA